jgi:tetratricopeptide (TPR) repeat protein
LNVSYVLEGSVRKAGNRVRVTAQLIEAATDKHVWSDTYDRDLTDIFAIQDEVAGMVADELEVRLLDSGQTQHRTSPEAYALYLQARHVFYGQAFDQGDKIRPMQLLQRALDRDPDFIPAMMLLSVIEWYAAAYSGEYSEDEKEEMFRRSRQRIQDAYFIDPNDALTNIYIVTVSDLEVQQTARYVERALSLDPGNVDVLRRSAGFAAGIGRFDDAIILGNRALARDPMCIQCYGALASIYTDAGRYDEAEAVLRRRIALVDDVGGHHNLAFIVLLQGNAQEAFEIFDGIASIEEHWLLTRALALHDLGRRDEVEDMLERFVEKYSDTDPYGVATLYAYTGHISSAISWMEKAIEEYPGELDHAVRDPFLASLHNTPQWPQWRKDAGLDEETLAAIEFTIPDFGTEPAATR